MTTYTWNLPENYKTVNSSGGRTVTFTFTAYDPRTADLLNRYVFQQQWERDGRELSDLIRRLEQHARDFGIEDKR